MEDRRGGSNGGQQRWVEWRTFEVARMEDRKGGWNGGLRQLYPRTMKVARMEDYNLALMEDTGVGSNGGQWWQLYWKTMEVALMEDCDVALMEDCDVALLEDSGGSAIRGQWSQPLLEDR